MRIERVRSRSCAAGPALMLGAALAWGCAARWRARLGVHRTITAGRRDAARDPFFQHADATGGGVPPARAWPRADVHPVSYTHLRAHETVLDLVCRLLLEKKKKKRTKYIISLKIYK